MQAFIPHLSNCKDTGEEPSSLHNSKHTHATIVQNTPLYSDGTTHIKYHRSTWEQKNLSNDIKHITLMQSVLGKKKETYTKKKAL